MNQQLIDKYNVRFENKILDFGGNERLIYKCIHMSDLSFGIFLNAWGNPQEINDLLIPDITSVLNGTSSLMENGSETISIDITPDNVIFYVENVGTNYPKIPTIDFYEIVLTWRDFLLQPPLNRTRV